MKEKKQPEFDAGYGLAVGLMLGVAIGVCLDKKERKTIRTKHKTIKTN